MLVNNHSKLTQTNPVHALYNALHADTMEADIYRHDEHTNVGGFRGQLFI